jgi:hypothetical protein
MTLRQTMPIVVNPDCNVVIAAAFVAAAVAAVAAVATISRIILETAHNPLNIYHQSQENFVVNIDFLQTLVTDFASSP